MSLDWEFNLLSNACRSHARAQAPRSEDQSVVLVSWVEDPGPRVLEG